MTKTNSNLHRPGCPGDPACTCGGSWPRPTRELTPKKLRILRLLRDRKPLNLARVWIELMELVKEGLAEAHKAANGQVEVSLTPAGETAAGKPRQKS